MTDEEFEAMYCSELIDAFDGVYEESDCVYANDLAICTHCEHWNFDSRRCVPDIVEGD